MLIEWGKIAYNWLPNIYNKEYTMLKAKNVIL